MTYFSFDASDAIQASGEPIEAFTNGLPFDRSGKLVISPTGDLGRRPPSTGDDSAAGYSVGDRWTYNGIVYQAVSVAEGEAVWSEVNTGNALLGNTVAGALGLWGLVKLRSAHAGFCFRAYRDSDNATLDIGFADDGSADWAAFNAFATSATYVTTLYDQSGNGYDLTQATEALMPRVLGYNLNGYRTISWDGGNAQRYLANTLIPYTNVRNSTAFMIGRWHDDVQKSSDLQIGNPTSKLLYFTDATGDVNYGFRVNSDGSLANSVNSDQLHVDQVRTYKNTVGAPSVQQNNQLSTYPITTASIVGSTGMILGGNNSDASFTGRFEFLACAFYDSALSSTNENAFRDRAYAAFNIKPQAVTTITGDGDSICLSLFASSYEAGWEQVMRRSLTKPVNVNGGGVSGRTAATVATYAANRIARCKGAGRTNIAIIFAGSNDMGLSATPPDTVFTSLQSISDTYRAGGYKVVMCTILPRNATFGGGQTGAQFEIDRLYLNTLIRAAGTTLYDALCDMGGDSLIGQLANQATYYVDTVHLNDLGYSILGTLARNAITPLL